MNFDFDKNICENKFDQAFYKSKNYINVLKNLDVNINLLENNE